MFHDAADMDVLAIAKRVYIHFNRIHQIAVDEDGALAGDDNGIVDIAFQMRSIAHDLHAATAQHVRGANDGGVADTLCDGFRFISGTGDPVGWLFEGELVEQGFETIPIFCKVNRVWRGAQYGNACALKIIGKFERRLSAELNDDAQKLAFFLFGAQNFENVLGSEGLEIKAIRRVRVGRDRFRVAIDHDAFDANISQCEGRMAAAIVKLDALTDAVGAATQDDCLPACGYICFAGSIARKISLVCRVHVRGF